MAEKMEDRRSRNARAKLLDAALMVIRTKGYSATTVDDLCAEAGVTKGAFFHHFRTKEDLAVAAAAHFGAMADELFSSAPFQAIVDPLERLVGYVEFRKAILQGSLPEFTCLVGTMVQEAYDSHPPIRDACNATISGHAAMVESFVAAVMAERGDPTGQGAASLALYTQAVLQGAFILAKARGGPDIAADCLDHLIRYVRLLFDGSSSREG
ncbi:Transcriptional regulator AcuR [Hartmannibacter diazotrophicus]|uniref:Transcriptional regulator AcuR n=1 Tax=Hartmannibacter diazotrophicus TaxID=1482074 RepID=A0A2C9D2E2_9HYPH|nr:TetR/AcrR family transcriptional regulator [Hartmannibacter diazotrophicus]SON54507.1 Transcriptional regulator AcuR [Hartmannibacter diazotrophicus]